MSLEERRVLAQKALQGSEMRELLGGSTEKSES